MSISVKKYAFACAFTLLSIATTAGAANIASQQDGNFNNPATWAGGVVPTWPDVATIGHAINTADQSADVGSLIVTAAGSLTLTDAPFYCYGNLTSAGAITGTNLVCFGSTSNLSGTFTAGLALFSPHTITTGSPISVPRLHTSGPLDVTGADITTAYLVCTGPLAGNIKYTTDGTLHYSMTGSYTPSGEWPKAPIASAYSPKHVEITNQLSMTLAGTSADTYPLQADGTLKIDGGGFETPSLDLGDVALTPLASINMTAGTSLKYKNSQLSAANIVLLGGATITSRQQITAPGTYPATALGASLQVTAVTASGALTITRRDQSHPSALPGMATGRWYDIVSAATGVTANVTLDYTHRPQTAEPYVCHYNGTKWTFGRTSQTANTVTWNGLTSFSPFALGDSTLGALPVAVSAFTLD